MRIGVISDTHDHWTNIEYFVDKFLENKVEAVYHCGDIVAPFMVKPFNKLKEKNIPLFAVFGNNDGERAGLRKIFGKDFKMNGDFFEQTITLTNRDNSEEHEVNERKILMFHHLSPEIVDALLESGKYDLILKGHTHQKLLKKVNNSVLLNPGEGCGYLTSKATAAIVNLIDLSVEFIEKEN